jgi:hypothetical protein
MVGLNQSKYSCVTGPLTTISPGLLGDKTMSSDHWLMAGAKTGMAPHRADTVLQLPRRMTLLDAIDASTQFPFTSGDRENFGGAMQV